MLKDFKAFLMRGNVVDLAVAVVLGAAFGAVVGSFVDNIINPIVGVLGGGNFDEFALTLTRDSLDKPESQLRWGAVVTQLINFVLVAAAIFFVVVKPMQVIVARRARGEEPVEDTPAPSDEALLLTEIRDLLRAQR
jgi:large conductance mechanosensitive channel